MKKWALKFAMGYLIKKLNTEKFQDTIVKTINSKVNIPKLTEKEEEKLFKAIIKAVISALKV